ncbi:S8 family serine peptidase [Oceanobacillus sp. CAU 1775]
MRRTIFLAILIFILTIPHSIQASELETIIIEVEGDVKEHMEYIKTHHPFIRIITSYSTIFNGLALEGKAAHFEKIKAEEFIRAIHDVQTYQATPAQATDIPEAPKKPTNQTFTGKNIKVAVIDTGIDYTHPDLKTNYKEGYDVYDFDTDPMETKPQDGMPTNHGTHVAGIIAANGEMEGVAKDASIYAYRALGPGGFGSTVHVLAALEQAVNDEVDVINLSLGNNVNGPDYPTSIAVNKAVELGIPVVIANGNSGPASWTVGAPATAERALSVGAATTPAKIPLLQHSQNDRLIPIVTMQGSKPWELTKKDYKIINADNTTTSIHGKIALYQRGEIPFQTLAETAQAKGAAAVLIYNSEEGELLGAIENKDVEITIPVAGISQADGEWLSQNEGDYLELIHEEIDTTIADFSSRGPVAVNWHIKPDILAPGTNIKSTVPGGYEFFNGTSMAAPYVTGVIAQIKEAHPTWNTETIFNALKTTAKLLTDENAEPFAPSIQGNGVIQPTEAINTDIIIHDKNLQFGMLTPTDQFKKQTIKIENRSNQAKHFTFQLPKNKQGIDWKLPLTVTVEANETKPIDINLQINSKRLDEGVHEGYLEVIEKQENKAYHLPYLFINKQANQPKTYGFEFALKSFSNEAYEYQVYATEELESFTVDLYDPDTLTHLSRIISDEEMTVGNNQGEIAKHKLKPGIYTALLTATTKSNIIEQEERILIIE